MNREGAYGFRMIQIQEIEKILNSEKVVVIDLRKIEKFKMGHIPNARNFPFEYIEEWRNEIPDTIAIILYCEHGNQSLLAARKLRGRKGAIYTLVGGYQEFIKKKGSCLH